MEGKAVVVERVLEEGGGVVEETVNRGRVVVFKEMGDDVLFIGNSGVIVGVVDDEVGDKDISDVEVIIRKAVDGDDKYVVELSSIGVFVDNVIG